MRGGCVDGPSTSKRALIARLLGVGWFVALTIAGGAVGGLALDGWLGTGPILTILGTLAGLAVAVAGMYLMLAAVLRGRPQGSPGDQRGQSGRA